MFTCDDGNTVTAVVDIQPQSISEWVRPILGDYKKDKRKRPAKSPQCGTHPLKSRILRKRYVEMNTHSIKENVRYLIVATLLALGVMTAVIATTDDADTNGGTAHQVEQMAGPTDDSGGG